MALQLQTLAKGFLMTWSNPIPEFKLVATADPESYRTMPWWPQMTTGVPRYNVHRDPLLQHPGAFGTARKHDVHTGVDLYVPEHSWVHAVETGKIVRAGAFTGTRSMPPTPWWNDTSYLMVEGESGVVCYGEIHCSWLDSQLREQPDGFYGDTIEVGETIGMIFPVLKEDKGRPRSMLHLELYEHGYRGEPVDWALGAPRPAGLLDPTPFLLELCK